MRIFCSVFFVFCSLSLAYSADVVRIHEENNGIIAGEAENFAEQSLSNARKWYKITPETNLDVQPDGDDNHAESASGNAYLEILPDTRRTHDDQLIHEENFSNVPGKIAILTYHLNVKTPGRYYVWVRAYSTTTEDNGIHVGLDGEWPEHGQRMQWCEGKDSWRWDSRQRTEENHCGERFEIYLDIEEAGHHTLHFSMREDGFEFDKWVLASEKQYEPDGIGPEPTIMMLPKKEMKD